MNMKAGAMAWPEGSLHFACAERSDSFFTTPMDTNLIQALTRKPLQTPQNFSASESPMSAPTTAGSLFDDSEAFPEGHTTVMLRNIACRYTQENLASILDELGLRGTYDFVYIPRSPARKSNLGYAFVNFLRPEYVEACKRLADGRKLGASDTTKLCQVTLAHVQGCPKDSTSTRRRSTKRTQASPLYVQEPGVSLEDLSQAFLEDAYRPGNVVVPRLADSDDPMRLVPLTRHQGLFDLAPGGLVGATSMLKKGEPAYTSFFG